MTRAVHLQWAKDRALEYVGAGALTEAFTSFHSDMNKHPETANHKALELGTMLLIGGHLNSQRQMREWIEGFK
jgi:hypothetical protein